jgi:hypothetical protein
VVSFAKKIMSLMDSTECATSSVSGYAHDASERASWIERIARKHLASHPEAPPASAPAAETPTDEAIEDFLAARMTQEGRVPMLRTIREALTHFAAPAAEVAQLMRFYAVDSIDALIAAQAEHIEKLQSKLPQAPSFAPQRVREG